MPQPLHAACTGRSDEAVRALLAAGPGAGARPNDDGNVPLHYAVRGALQPATLAALADHCDLQTRNRGGETALFIAAWRGREDHVMLLLGKGAMPTHIMLCLRQKPPSQILLFRRRSRCTNRQRHWPDAAPCRCPHGPPALRRAAFAHVGRIGA